MKKIIIFGTGQGGENAFAYYNHKHNIAGFCDSNRSRQGKPIRGIPVCSPEELTGIDFDIILICSLYHEEILARLEELGIPSGKIEVCHREILEGKGHIEIFPYNYVTEFIPHQSYREEVFRNMHLGVEYTYSMAVEGDICEFGAGSGQTGLILANAVKKCEPFYQYSSKLHGLPAKKLFYFDSFTGFPESTTEPDISSPHVASGIWPEGGSRGISAFDLENELLKIVNKESFNIIKGWFSDTLEQIPTECKFALVHLDCDLYESTFQVLDYLYLHNHLADGAILLFDDWNCNRASDDFGQRKAWCEIVRKYNPRSTDLGYYGLFSHKKIVHMK